MIRRCFPANPHPGRIYYINGPDRHEYWRWTGKRWSRINREWDMASEQWVKINPVSGLHLQLTGGGLWI